LALAGLVLLITSWTGPPAPDLSELEVQTTASALTAHAAHRDGLPDQLLLPVAAEARAHHDLSAIGVVHEPTAELRRTYDYHRTRSADPQAFDARLTKAILRLDEDSRRYGAHEQEPLEAADVQAILNALQRR
jgi:hypothetical protein